MKRQARTHDPLAVALAAISEQSQRPRRSTSDGRLLPSRPSISVIAHRTKQLDEPRSRSRRH